MEIRDIILIIFKRWIMIVAAVLAFGLIAGYYAYFVLDNEYQSTAVMIINSNYSDSEAGTEKQILSDQYYNIQLVESYQVLCQTERILDQVISETGIRMTTEELAKLILVSSKKGTTIIDISATTADPLLSATIANSVANVFIKEVPQIMKMNNVQVIDYAEAPALPSGPNRQMIAFVGLLLGLFVGVLIAFAIEYFDDTLKSGEQLENLLEVPMIGSVPNLQEGVK